jgi:hypothetical protein
MEFQVFMIFLYYYHRLLEKFFYNDKYKVFQLFYVFDENKNEKIWLLFLINRNVKREKCHKLLRIM